MFKILFQTTKYPNGQLIRFQQPKNEINFVDVTSCYVSYLDANRNSKYFKERCEIVLKEYHNKFFVRLLKYV